MSDYDRTDRFDGTEDGMQRFGRWLSRRPAESWVFFAAGIVIGGLLF
ncbi:MAG: hypothetical protein AAGF33_10540 [Pseudomonadota bacterium]